MASGAASLHCGAGTMYISRTIKMSRFWSGHVFEPWSFIFFGMQVAVVLQISQCYTSGLMHSGLDFRGFSRGEFCAWHASKVRGSFNPPCHKNTKIRAVNFFQQQAVSSAVSTHPEMTSLPKFTCKIPSACLSESSQACKYQHGLQSYTSCHGGSFGFVKDICLQTTDRTKTPVDPWWETSMLPKA